MKHPLLIRACLAAVLLSSTPFIAQAASSNDDPEILITDGEIFGEVRYRIAPGIKGHGFTLKAGYEELGGDGTDAFQTPLATLHKFNGWADAFLNTPAQGLEDLYISGAYKVSGTDSILDGVKLKAVYHDFESNSGSSDFGDELDLSIGKTFTLPDAGQPFKKVNVTLKYADYNGDSGIASREKAWLQIGIKF